jgi:cytochrome c oxidase assembly factor CtaG
VCIVPGLTQAGKTIYQWFEDRFGLGKPVIEAAEHEVPESTASWWYVFGSAATVLLVMQVMTGVLLGLVYSPSAGHAWASLEFLDHSVKLGWFLRALHGWGSDFMIAIVLIHMAQVFLFGAYKFPRELTWIVGVISLLLTLAMAFTGQVLRFDQDSYWGLGIGASIVSRVPWIGRALVKLMLGGPIIAGPTLTRFFALHVFIIPGLLIAMVGVHLWMVLRLGINEWPMPGRLVSKTAATIYVRGWFVIRKTRKAQFPAWRLGSILVGLATIWIAIASPLDGCADALLSAHMVEHLLLMSFVPPLLLMGLPVVPLLRGLPSGLLTHVGGPLIRNRSLRRLCHWLTMPLIAWLAMNLTFLGWHIPAAYDFALEHEHWHEFEHLCFLGTLLLFWWPLVRPWPTRAASLGWFMLPYLVVADIVNTILSAFLAFCDRPVNGYYLKQPNAFGISPMADQLAGAAAMWVIGSTVFLIPVVLLTVRLLQPGPSRRVISRS